MACINVTSVKVLNNPAPLKDDFKFEIAFECLQPLKDDIEWKIVYVGSVSDGKHDQVLDAIDMECGKVGSLKFVFEAPAPDYSKVPERDLLGVTAVMIVASYKGQSFIRIAYYVRISYTEQELIEDPPEEPVWDKLQRFVVDSDPRVTRSNIAWDRDEILDEGKEATSKVVVDEADECIEDEIEEDLDEGENETNEPEVITAN